ncbi:MAG: hypothetical protein ABJB21_04985 [bacterium]
MKASGFQLRRIGSLGGPIRLFLSVLMLFGASVGSAQKVQPARVPDSILGVGIGSTLDQAHAKLDRLRTRKARSTREDSEEEAREEQEQEREGGRKEAWALRATNYATVALQVDREGRVVWITGFVRPGKEIPFAKLGNLSSATIATETRAVWNVPTPSGGYRVIAKGQHGSARVVSILSLASPPVE